MKLDYDLVIYDAVGVPCTGTTYRYGGLGGSEFEAILLAEGLAKLGYSVAYVNQFKFPTFEYGVQYFPLDYIDSNVLKCKTILVMRSSPFPYAKLDYENVRFWLTDLPNEQQVTTLAAWLAPGRPGRGVCVSGWHRSLFPQDWNFTHIYNMIPDWVYDLPPKPKNPNKYVYISAALKGLDQTVDAWREFKKSYFLKKAELNVAHPGYDRIDHKKLQDNKINFLGSMPFHLLVQELETAKHMFFVNTFPETFSIAAVLAETMGVTPQILCTQHPGALPEVLTNTNMLTSNVPAYQQKVFENAKTPPVLMKAREYKQSVIVQQWIKELAL